MVEALPTAPVDPLPSETITEEPLRWSTSSWRGFPNYECAHNDGYATLSLEDIEDHWRRVHGPPPEPEPAPKPLLYDRFNNPIG